jgi:hypothetical protein
VSRYLPEDLEPAERPVHRVLSAVLPQPLPIGFREQVMRRISGQGVSAWEWILAAVLAVPSLAFLAFQLLDRGDEFAAAINNVVVAASSDAADAFFFIDGTTVLALVLLGIASLIAAHAAIVAAPAGRHPAGR